MTKQFLYGYRLLAPDGTISPWSFYNEDDIRHVNIKLKNGANYSCGFAADEALRRWCVSREFKYEKAVFQFNPEWMEFTEMKD